MIRDIAAARRWSLIIDQLAAAQLELARRKLYQTGKSRP